MKQEKAFGFLEDLRKKFLSCFDSDRIYTAFAFELKPFNEEIKKLMEFHQKNPKTKNELMRDALVESAVYIQESYEQLLDRDQKLTIISEKSQTANQNSFIFKDQVIVCFEFYFFEYFRNLRFKHYKLIENLKQNIRKLHEFYFWF